MDVPICNTEYQESAVITMNEQRLGIAASLLIHAALLSLLFILPVAKLAPVTPVMQLHFVQDHAFSARNQEISERTLTPPKAAPVQTAESQKVAAVAVPIQKAEIRKSVEIHQGKQPEANKNPLNEKALKATDQNKVINRPESSTQGAIKRDMATPIKASTPLIVETTFGNRNAPAFIHRETPLYPLLARRLGKEGKVVLKLMIDRDGRLLEIEVIERAAYGFTEAAVEAVKRSTYAPALHNGVKVTARAILPIRFHLE
jgi:periplasmic protein TonB